jgi:hypothetical protein
VPVQKTYCSICQGSLASRHDEAEFSATSSDIESDLISADTPVSLALGAVCHVKVYVQRQAYELFGTLHRSYYTSWNTEQQSQEPLRRLQIYLLTQNLLQIYFTEAEQRQGDGECHGGVCWTKGVDVGRAQALPPW